MGSNLDPVELVLDLNGPFTWADCGSISASGSRQPVKACSLKCSMAGPTKGCFTQRYNSSSCTLPAENTASGASASGEVDEDEIAMEFWAGPGLSSSLARNERFLFSCAPTSLLEGLADGSKGVFGLGNSRISLPSQFSTSFGPPAVMWKIVNKSYL
ncbi:eukaryotic aspartyl protease family protein [Striga asiatica]|uniref:Eukaryotic aspartyl protease family protein n=1 Tax=Striga asiatica TaxID=4170 RepID=A0A5A7PX72_STRAF|nr:eukaryotic aspartyl protease family protein [Striga asiatica]